MIERFSNFKCKNTQKLSTPEIAENASCSSLRGCQSTPEEATRLNHRCCDRKIVWSAGNGGLRDGGLSKSEAI